MNLDLAHLMRPGTLQLSALPPLSVYVHLPWCLKKCPYCDFNSHEWRGQDLQQAEQAYLDAVCADLEASLPLIWGRSVQSIFIGGGTPSLLSPAGIERLLADLRARLRLVADCEITLEANPGTFEQDRFKAFRQAGVNRLSIGVQSFDDAKLKALGRVHDRQPRHLIDEAEFGEFEERLTKAGDVAKVAARHDDPVGHFPAQRLEQVRLAATVRPDHAREAALDHELCRLDERLEAGQAKLCELHSGTPGC